MEHSKTTPLEALMRPVLAEVGNGVSLGWCTIEESGRTAEYAGGRRAAREALRRAGYGEDATLLVETETGLPRWPTGWVGSISHSRKKCVSGVVFGERFRGIGIDLEHLGRMRASTIRKVCSEEELAALPKGREIEMATRLFNLKEAFYKAQSPVFHLEPNFTDLSLKIDWESPVWRPTILRKSGVLDNFNPRISLYGWVGSGLCFSIVLIEEDAENPAESADAGPEK